MPEESYIIVKHAADSHWNYYYNDDPKLGVCSSHSAHETYSGRSVGIKASYNDKNEAEADCLEMNICNPCGYAVCPVLQR